MIVKINGMKLAMLPNAMPMNAVDASRPTERPTILRATDWALEQLDKPIVKSAISGIMIVSTPHVAWAVGTASGGWALIKLLQQGAFWVGLAVSLWGVYEWMVGGPGWKERIMKGVLGYLLCLVLPLIFVTLRNAGIGQ